MPGPGDLIFAVFGDNGVVGRAAILVYPVATAGENYIPKQPNPESRGSNSRLFRDEITIEDQKIGDV